MLCYRVQQCDDKLEGIEQKKEKNSGFFFSKMGKWGGEVEEIFILFSSQLKKEK